MRGGCGMGMFHRGWSEVCPASPRVDPEGFRRTIHDSRPTTDGSRRTADPLRILQGRISVPLELVSAGRVFGWLGVLEDEAAGFVEQLGGAEGFGEEEGGAGVAGFVGQDDVAAGGEEDDWDAGGDGIVLEMLKGGEAVHFWHEHIHDDEFRLVQAGEFEGFATVAADDDVVTTPSKAEFGDAEDVGFVVHDEDASGHGMGESRGWTVDGAWVRDNRPGR